MHGSTFYRRNLPHWHPSGIAIFVTSCLHGSLPSKAIEQLRTFQESLQKEIDRDSGAANASRIRHYKKVFARLDRILDRAKSGPLWLKDGGIASMVEEALLVRYASLYKLWAYVVMANHMHLLLTPSALPNQEAYTSVSLSVIMQRLKGYTAREANLILGRTGEPFWQAESFDHWPRDEAEFFRIVSYIENNPVSAGLVSRAGDWHWSSAGERKRRGWSEVRALTG